MKRCIPKALTRLPRDIRIAYYSYIRIELLYSTSKYRDAASRHRRPVCGRECRDEDLRSRSERTPADVQQLGSQTAAYCCWVGNEK